MADISVRRLAEKLNSNLENLILQLKKAGLNKTEEDSLTDLECKSFLDFVMKKDRVDNNEKPKTLSLRGKRTSEQVITNTNAAGRKHKIEVVRRKKRVVQKKASLINESGVFEQGIEPSTSELNKNIINEVDVSSTVPDLSSKDAQVSVTTIDTSVNTEVTKETHLEKEKEKKEQLKSGDKKKEKKRSVENNSKAVVSDDSDSARVKISPKVKKQLGDDHWDSKRVLDQLTVDQEGLDDLLVINKVNIRSKSSFDRSPKKSKDTVNYGNIMKSIKPEHAFERPSAPMVYEVAIHHDITVGELADRMAVKSSKLIKTLMQMGIMATINQALEQDTAVLLVEEFGHKPKLIKVNAIEEEFKADYDKKLEDAKELSRAPVVTIMGHVDHGKTSLLDYIRRTKVTDKEAGGITQHIGAYSVNTGHGKITFLDTPGHAAFSAMRARGANVTDVVILVVSADDGVMPQTLEAIQHAKAAGVPIVVAVNKIDKSDADPERVKNELTQQGIIPEEWGGENQFVLVSAKTGAGIDSLLDAILVQTEILELKAPVDVPAKGIVIEARLDKGRGVVATVLVQKGTLSKGDIVVAGCEYGRVRAMVDAAMQKVETAYPSDPVEILGLSAPPKAGDEVIAVETERNAREIAIYRQSKLRIAKHAKQEAGSIEDLFSKTKDSDQAVLNVVIKADVQGSAEAIVNSLEKISTTEAKVKIIGVGVGGINESDVTLAMASHAIIIGFNVRADNNSKKLAEIEGVKITYESIIYNVIDDIKSILSGMLSPEIREEIVGLAEVRDVFRSSKFGAVAGCMVIDGIIKRNNPIRVLRDNVVIYEGQLESLRRFKEDVNEVKQGIECGIGVKNYNDIKQGDHIEVFKRIEVVRTL